MKFFILLILLSITTVNSLLLDETDQRKFTVCDGGPYPNTITNILISPNPLVIGQSASYTFNGTRNVEILKGSIGDYEFTYGLNIYSTEESTPESIDKPPKPHLFRLIIKDPKEIFLSCIQGSVDLSYVFIASSNGP